jgi:uncharacterized protein (DUF302 family)
VEGVISLALKILLLLPDNNANKQKKMDNLITLKSNYSAQDTADRIVENIKNEDWHVFARIDHAKEAEKVGLHLRPTVVILFGNPKIGTSLMQNSQSSAIDLPMKALVMEKESGEVIILYNDLDWLKNRHLISDKKTLDTIRQVVEKVCKKAIE